MDADTVVNKALVERFWATFYERDYDAIAAFFGPESRYTDMCTPDDDVAIGPAQIVRRLRLGLEPIERFEHAVHATVADGDTVMVEHTETWHWHTGESVANHFVTVMVVHGGAIARWSDYWDLQTLLAAAPAWWVEHIMGGWTD